MAGFFGFFDYSKPGPGVDKDEDPKHPIFVFIDVFLRKFWKLMSLNILFFILNIPAILGAFILGQVLYQSNVGQKELAADLIIRLIVMGVFLFIPIITVGPFQAGFTYVLRNYSREEHSFIWSDFWKATKENFVQGLLVSVIDFVIVFIIGFSFNLYGSLEKGNYFFIIARTLLVVAFVIFYMMHIYIYPMMVTFKLTLKQLYQNALIFVFTRLFLNILITLICLVIAVGPYVLLILYGINPVIYMLFVPFILFSLIGLLTNSFAYPALKKYILDKIDDEENKPEIESVFSDKKKL